MVINGSPGTIVEIINGNVVYIINKMNNLSQKKMVIDVTFKTIKVALEDGTRV